MSFLCIRKNIFLYCIYCCNSYSFCLIHARQRMHAYCPLALSRDFLHSPENFNLYFTTCIPTLLKFSIKNMNYIQR